MKVFVIGFLLGSITLTNACLEPIKVTIKNYEGPIYVTSDQIFDNRPPVYDNRPPTLATACDQAPILHTCVCDVCPPTLTNFACDQPVLHTYVYETDCKCLTKQTINTPIYGTSVDTSSSYYPGGYYSYLSPASCDHGCPKIAESLTPLLKTYLSQCSCPKQGCQCGQSYYH